MERLKQAGITLIELIVVLGISGFVVTAAAAVINQTLLVGARNDARLLALRQVQTAGAWVSRDVSCAHSIIFDDPDTSSITELITLEWQDWPVKLNPEQPDSDYQTTAHRVAYYLNEDDELVRHHTIETTITDAYGEEQSTSSTTQEMPIAYYIDPDEEATYCAWDDDTLPIEERVIIFQVTSEVHNQTESRTYRIKPRPLPSGDNP